MSDPKSRDETRIDLGDDLVEKTAILEHGSPRRRSSDRFDTEDQFESARILMSEGLLEEAKKLLRRIQIRDPGHVPSRQKLDEIHDLELKQMLGEGASTRRSWDSRSRREEIDPVQASAEEVILRLERDLQLGAVEAPELGGSIDEQFGAFGDAVDEQLRSASARDRIDAGIAFLELGLYGLACRQFENASHDVAQRPAALSLYAYAMILAGRPFEALMALESALADPDVGQPERIEFVYLVGRAQEGLKRPDLARVCYETVNGWEQGYRDVQDRLRRLSS